jgi:hypothetical protein
MSWTPNRSVVIEGLGRLPQFSHATVEIECIARANPA